MIKQKAPLSRVFNMDNLVFMRNCKDKQFDVAVVDPEYRDENQPDIANRAKGGFKTWFGAPKEEFFHHLFRISSEQIIFGGNYFTNLLTPKNNPYLYANNNWYIWDKKLPRGMHYSQFEMAWVSDHVLSERKINTRIFRNRSDAESWHETGKPMELYNDLFKLYLDPIREKLKRNVSIIDTNLGSGASRIAAYVLGFDFTGIELNKEYFDRGSKDFELYKKNNSLFLPYGVDEDEIEFELI